MKYNINDYTLEEKISQLLMFAFHGTTYNNQLETIIKDLKIGGIIYFSRNITTVEEVKKLNQKIQEESKIPMFISIDQEGGIVQRITEGVTFFPGAMAFTSAKESPYKVCKSVAIDLKEMGFNMNFAPCADCNSNPLNPVINSRSFSDNPNECALYVKESFKGFQDGGILPTAKHFPGHGDTHVDSHISLPLVNKSIEELKNEELIPFAYAIENGIDGIMVSHILFPSVDETFPATLSKKIVTGLLKEEMNFKGLIVTDSLTMGAIINNYSYNEIVRYACNAGIDLLVFCGKADLESQIQIRNAFIEEVKLGNISLDRINESFNKIMAMKEKYIENKYTNLNDRTSLGKDISKKSIALVKDMNVLPVTTKDKVLLLFPKLKVFTLVDNDNDNYITLKDSLEKENYNVYEIIYEENEEDYKKIIDIQKNYDKIILATYNCKSEDYQVSLYNCLDKSKTVIVSMRSPYDILYLKDVMCYICIYETTQLSFDSFAYCLKYNKFEGKLPVKL